MNICFSFSFLIVSQHLIKHNQPTSHKNKQTLKLTTVSIILGDSTQKRLSQWRQNAIFKIKNTNININEKNKQKAHGEITEDQSKTSWSVSSEVRKSVSSPREKEAPS